MGSISLLQIIINRMVQSNQESCCALEDYIKTFDICNFPGEEVTEASLRIKAIAHSIGKDNLPKDIIFCVLEGFSLASTPGFQSLCHCRESMLSTSAMTNSSRNTSLYSQLVDVLHDLELKFIDLHSGRRCLGVGHGNAGSKLVFHTHCDDYIKFTPDDPTEEYSIYKAVMETAAVHFNEWVKDKTCHHCNKIGHIRGEKCPKYISDVFAGRMPLPKKKQSSSKTTHSTSFTPRHSRDYRSTNRTAPHTKQAMTTTIAAEPSDSDYLTSSSSTTDHQETPSGTHSAFLDALGCPKE